MTYFFSKIASTKALILASFLLVSPSYVTFNFFNKPKKIVVFVHGTILPGLALLNPYKSYTQSLATHDWYHRCMAKVRKDPLFQEDSLMLDEGMHKIEPVILLQYAQRTLPTELAKKGAYQSIGAYHSLAQDFDPIDTDYYTFGFSGIFSTFHRKEAAAHLYKELYTLVQKYSNQGYTPSITLHGYSHGGNVLLYLADIENQEKKHLFIENLFLLGTPIQAETAFFAFHPLFSTIINLYSEGDSVQGADTFSTPSGTSYHTFKELFTKHNIPYKHKKNIFDIRLLADKSNTAFGHFTFWFLNQYNLPFFSTGTPQANAIRDALNPLPLVTLSPAIFSLLEQAYEPPSSIDLSITATPHTCVLTLNDPLTQQFLAQSDNIRPTLQKAQNYTNTSWLPHAQATETTRILTGLLAAFKTLSKE